MRHSILMFVFVTIAVSGQNSATSQTMREAVVNSDWPTVERMATKVLVKSPRDRTASLLLTMALLHQNKLPQALNSAKKTIDIDSSLMQGWIVASECQTKLGLYDEAIGTLLQAQHRFPDSVQPTWALGMAYARAGKCQEAITPLEETMFRRPDVSGVIQQLAQCYFTTQRYAEAADLYGRVVELEPANGTLQQSYGEALLSNHQFEPSIVHLREAIRLDPTLTSAYLTLTGALQELGRTEDAIVVANQFVRISPDDPMGWYNVGLIHLALNQPDSAIPAFKRAIVLRPSYYEAYFNIAFAYEGRGFQEDAIISFKRCISLSPILAPDAYNSLAIIYRDEGRFQDALAAHDQAIALRDTASALYVSRLNTYFEAQQCKAASLEIDAVLLKFPNNASILYTAALCLVRNGTLIRVKEILKTLDSLSPTMAEQLRKLIET